jgi:pyruvate dehydrogenase E2 component (dihydrolipoamide acetyltransferase)
MADFVMPSLGADMESGVLLEWRVKPGDAVARGDIVAVVDTSKAEVEVEIFEDGVIDRLLVEEGTRVPVGAPLASLREAPATPAPVPTPPAEPIEPAEAVEPAEATPVPPAPVASPLTPEPPTPEHRPRVSPLARRTAEQLGVDLDAVKGSGASGAIARADVERAAHPTGLTEGSADREAAMRQAIGALMSRSKREIPHYYLQRDVDMSQALAWLEGRNLERAVGDRLLPSVLLIGAVAKAAAETPSLNGFWVDGSFHPADGVHLGIAISLRGGGLIAPALHDADRKGLDQLMAELSDLVRRGRAGRMRSSEMSDPTITVTNLGEKGADLVHGVIYPPQVALVGFGGVRVRPWAVDGMIGSRPIVTATLAADHRASDGHTGSRFLALIDRYLQRPEGL